MEQSSITGITVVAVAGCGSLVLVIGHYLVPKLAVGLGKWKGEALQGGGPHYCDDYGKLKNELDSTTSKDKSNVVIRGEVSRHNKSLSYKEEMHAGPAKQEISVCLKEGEPKRYYPSYSSYEYEMNSKTEIIVTKKSHAVPFTMTDKSNNSITVKELHSSYGFQHSSALKLAAENEQKESWNRSYILKYGSIISVIGHAKLEEGKVVFYPKEMGKPVDLFIKDSTMIKWSKTISRALSILGISLLAISIIMLIWPWVKKWLMQKNSEPVQERGDED